MEQNAPIGILDSGIGGLSVLKEIRRVLPKEHIIYVGDTARMPYGARNPKDIIAFMHQALRFFEGQGVKMAVIACNTMTTFGYVAVKLHYPFLFAAMNSGVLDAAAASRSKKIGVIATVGTVENRMHLRSVEELGLPVELHAKACPDFAPLIESGVISGKVIESAARCYLEDFKDNGVDALILGCTHYPLISGVIERYLGSGVTLINPACATARDMIEILRSAVLLRKGDGRGAMRLYFSAGLETARQMTDRVLGGDRAEFETIDLTWY